VKSSALVTQSGADIGSGGAIWKSVTPLRRITKSGDDATMELPELPGQGLYAGAHKPSSRARWCPLRPQRCAATTALQAV